jgi:chemotaxis protein methyltransferase CheR
MTCTEAEYAYLREVVFKQSANVLDASRDYLFERRLHRLMHTAGLSNLQQLVDTLRSQRNPMLPRSVAEAMTVNETSFFRDSGPFDLIRYELLPTLIERRKESRQLRFWSAACSSGQEAYSLAMLLREYFPELNQWKIEIVGTDISAEMVQRAQRGRYQRIEVNRGLPVRHLLRYMMRVEDEWEIIPSLKSMCFFQQRSLTGGPMMFERFDGILLRNVMLYFSAETRSQVLLYMHRMLAADGFLILGSSEQPDLPEHWQAVLSQKACFYRPIYQG